VEVLLNLCWLLLIGLAFGFWVRHRRDSKSLRLALALACLCVLLFPVISATDDLHAMRQEAEEFGSAKKTLHQSSSHGPGEHDLSAPPALLGTVFQAPLYIETCGLVSVLQTAAPLTAWTTISPSRAPPSSLLA
jgi:hypothetical protein